MRKMATPPEHTPLGQLAERYWVESRRPLASLVFIAPLMILYEAGVLLLGSHQNGADAFLRRLLELLGFGQHFLLPILTVCILLAWHYLSREPWRLSGGILSGMAIESLMLGLCLRAVLFVQNGLFLSIGERFQDAVGFLGAGIYEELLFRLILLSLLAWAFRHAGTTPRMSMILAVIVSSLLFSAAHHVGPYGEKLEAYRFLFRFVAGVFFSILFVYRGFGIAAGSHAAYDILVGVFG
jgi:membrane protease YdiL (CAAX protease family)